MGGGSISITASCTSGTAALMLCAERIRQSDSDIGLVVGADAISKSLFLGEGLTGELSKRNHDPARASRPFDRDQDGYIIGEGAVALVLEKESHALSRDAKIYSEIGPFSSTTDATSFKYINENGTQMARGMTLLLDRAPAGKIDYVNAHGPSIAALDKAESNAIRIAFGELACSVPVTSIKGSIGNPSAAGGMLQVASEVLSIRDNVIPPTLNLDNPLPGCELNYVRREALAKDVNTVLVSTHGGGGINVALIVNRYHSKQPESDQFNWSPEI